MDMLLLACILVLNVVISVWNCYAVGQVWNDVKLIGTTFDKVLSWSAIIQSAVGFSMPILLLLAWICVSVLTSGQEPAFSPEEAKVFMEAIFNLWYLAIIFPVLGTGLVIWAHSVRMAYQRRDFASIASAGWNTFAQVHNTISAFNNVGGALGNIGDFFGSALSGKGDGKEKGAILVVLLVILALVAGFVIAFSLVNYFANRSASVVEQTISRHEHQAS